MSASNRVPGSVVANVVGIVAGVAALAGAAHASEPSGDAPCGESRHRADAAATTTIIARPVAIADAGGPCPPSGTAAARGCITGVVRHGATCAAMPDVQLEAGIPTRRTTVTDAAGAYRLCGLGRGEHELVVPYLGVVRMVRAGDVADVDAPFLGDLGIRLAVTSIVTFEIDRTIDGAALASPATVFVQATPPPGPERDVELVEVRPALALGEPVELRVARDPATGVLVSETCWIRTPAAPTPSPDAAPAPAPTTPVPRSQSCAHCGAADPASALLTAAALIAARRRRP